MTKISFALLLGAALTLGVGAARAETTTSSKAAAEALFQQGTELVTQGEFAAACEKFEASQKLDPALGTVLRWADCLDRAGKTASSWALFREAAAIARGRGETERERIAEQRASYLQQNLSLLELESSARTLPKGLEVRVNGAPIPAESLGAPLPVDPGDTEIVVSAPGYKPWKGKLAVKQGPSRQKLRFPALEPAPRPKLGATPARSARGVAAGDGAGAYRTAGLITGSVGLLGLAGSAVLGLRAADLGSESRAHCQETDVNACDQTGYELREDALRFADAATVSGVVGGALVLTGVGLIVFAPSSRTELSAGAGNLRLRGRF